MNLHVITAKLLRPSVNSITASINRKVAQLQTVAANNDAAANRAYHLAAKLDSRGDSATYEAARARRVAQKLQNLVG